MLFWFWGDTLVIVSGDKLICIIGNPFFEEGSIYTVGDVVTKDLFEIKIGLDEYWYAKKCNERICVHFNSNETAINDAWFQQVK